MILYHRKSFMVPRKAWVVFCWSSTIITSDSFLSVALLQIDQFRLFELIEGISEHKTPENGPKTHHVMIYDHFLAIHRGHTHNSHRNCQNLSNQPAKMHYVEHPINKVQE